MENKTSMYFKLVANNDCEDILYIEYAIHFKKTVQPCEFKEGADDIVIAEVRKALPSTLSNYDIIRISEEEYNETFKEEDNNGKEE